MSKFENKIKKVTKIDYLNKPNNNYAKINKKLKNIFDLISI